MCTNKLTSSQLACQHSWIKALHWNHRGHTFRFCTGLNSSDGLILFEKLARLVSAELFCGVCYKPRSLQGNCTAIASP